MMDMFRSDGWQELITEAQDKLKAAEKIDSIQAEKELWFRKGQINTLRWLIGMETALEAAYEDQR